MRLPVRFMMLAAAAAAGFVVVTMSRGCRDRRIREVLGAVRGRPFTGLLDPARPLDAAAGTPVIRDAGRQLRFAYWSQPGYAGPIEDDAVRIIVDANRAESLETHLGPDARARLSDHLRDAERAIKETGLLAHEEGERTKELLRSRPDRHFVIHGSEPEKDPLWARVVRERERLWVGQKGDLASEPLQLARPDYKGEPATIYYVIDYAEWPVLRALAVEYNRAVRHRLRLARAWIANEYARRGMRLFSSTEVR